MIITCDGNEFEIGIISFTPVYDSRIEWKKTGTKWHSIDKGISYSKWSSEITIRGSGTDIVDIRDAMNECANSGLTFTFKCGEYEPIFGPEFDYSADIECIIDASDAQYVTGNMNNIVFTEWSFKAFPVSIPNFAYINVTSFPVLQIDSISRNDNGSRVFNELESTRTSLGFLNNSKVTTVRYTGKYEFISKAKIYLIGLRNNTMTTLNNSAWFFEKDVFTDSAYVLSITDNGPLDKACIEYSISVTFAKA